MRKSSEPWKNKLGVYASLLLCLALLVTACGTGANGNGEPRAVEGGNGDAAGSLEKVSIMLDWYPNAVHSGLYTAIAKGYFAAEGLEVEVVMPAETNDPLRLVAAEQVDLALNYQPQVLLGREEGLPVVSLAALVRHPLNHLLVSAESSIHSPKDLAGKKVGYPSIPLNEAMIRTMMQTDGSSASEVDWVDVGWDLIPALGTGRVEALFGGFINHEKVLLEKQGMPMRVIDVREYGVPDYYELVLVTSANTLQQKRALLEGFWRALARGQQDVVAQPEEGLGYLLAAQNEAFPLEEDVEQQSLSILLPLMDAGEHPFGYQSEASWQEAHDWLVEQSMLTPFDVNEAFFNLAQE